MKNNLISAIKKKLDKEAQELHKNVRGSCEVSDCPNDAIALGMCNAHYLRYKNNRPIETPVQKRGNGNCVECNKPINGKGGWQRCGKHYKAARQKAIKEALVEAMGGCCQNCGHTFPLPVYDFHHYTGKKESNPSAIIINGSLERIAEELSNCILLCANCHRIEHAV